MGYVKRLPYLLGISFCIIIGFISYGQKLENNSIYIRMLIALIAFYIIGIIIKNTVITIVDEKKKKEQENKLKEQQEKEEAEKLEQEKSTGVNVDYAVGDKEKDLDFLDEEFKPLNADKII